MLRVGVQIILCDCVFEGHRRVPLEDNRTLTERYVEFGERPHNVKREVAFDGLC